MRCSGLSEQQKDDVVLYDKPPKNFVCSLCKAMPKGAAKAKGGQKRAAPGSVASKTGMEKAGDGEWEPGDGGAPPPAKRPRGRPPLERTESKKESLKKKILPSKRGRPPSKR